MFNDNIRFHSGRDYPAIKDHGTTSFTKTGTPTAFSLCTVTDSDEYLVFKEVGGVRDLIYTGTDSSTVYRLGTTLYAYLADYDSYAGTFYWRVYGD